MNFWKFNALCYMCQTIFDPQCKNIFKESNMSLGLINNNNINKNNCYLENISLLDLDKEKRNKTIIKYNYNDDIEEIVDYIEKEIPLEESFSFYLYTNISENNLNFISGNKKSLFTLLPNLYETTRNISGIYFDTYIDENNGFFDEDGNLHFMESA